MKDLTQNKKSIFNHINIIKFVGILFKSPDWWIITELASLGSVDNYLKSQKIVTAIQLIQM